MEGCGRGKDKWDKKEWIYMKLIRFVGNYNESLNAAMKQLLDIG